VASTRRPVAWAVIAVLALAAAACGGTPPAAATEINVEGREFFFAPSELSASAGEIKVTLTNAGIIEHDFHIDAIPTAHVLSDPGEANEVTFTAEAGVYEFYCTIPGHREAGMVGTLTVTP
jgi:plastocyanin